MMERKLKDKDDRIVWLQYALDGKEKRLADAIQEVNTTKAVRVQLHLAFISLCCKMFSAVHY